MDYCYTCRRTLNGALVCPGCGAYAPDIDPQAARPGARFEGAYAAPGAIPAQRPHGSMPEPMPAAAPVPKPRAGYDAPAAFDARADGPGADGTDDDGGDGEASVLGSAAIAPTLHRGRAARRRQLARWKKTRRRAGVATAVALFGGGVTVASMSASHGGKGATASASTRDDIAPVTLNTNSIPGSVALPDGTGPAGTGTAAGHAPTSHKVALPQQRTGAHAAPDVRTTQAGTDDAGRTLIGGSPNGSTGTTATTDSGHQAGYSASVPQTSVTTPPADTGSTGSTGSGGATTTTGSDTGSGSTATTPPATGDPSTPPATTAPATPPQQQLCLLIICLG
jgi:hypothetical protein